MTSAFSRRDEAENSIMQTISIAVSAILIAAGLVTAPSLINNARDVNAKGDLANVAYAEEAGNADAGHYFQNVNRGEPSSLADYRGPDGRIIKYTTSGDVFNIGVTCGEGDDSTFVLKTLSASGHTFYRTSESTRITETAPAYADTGLADCARPVTPARFSVFTRLTLKTPVMLASYQREVNADGTSSATNPAIAVEPGALAFTTHALPDGAYGSQYNATLETNNPATLTVSGDLPPGITLSNGVLTGKPTRGGTYNFTVTATAGKDVITQDLSIKVTKVDLDITTTSLPDVNYNESYTADLQANRDGATFSVTGTLPPGITLTGHTLSGTATTPGRYAFTVKATEGEDTVSRSLAINVTYTSVPGWTGTSPVAAKFANGSQVVSKDGATVAVAGTGGIYLSLDGGNSYKQVLTGAASSKWRVAMSSTGDLAAGQVSGALYAGAINRTAGTVAWTKQYYNLGSSGQLKYQGGRMLMETSGSTFKGAGDQSGTWGFVANNGGRSMDMASGTNFVFDSPIGIYTASGTRHTPTTAIGSLQLAMTDAGLTYGASSDGKVYRLAFNDSSYAYTGTAMGTGPGAWTDFAIATNGTFVGVSGGKVYKSTDTGKTWTEWSPVTGVTAVDITRGGNMVSVSTGTDTAPGFVYTASVD